MKQKSLDFKHLENMIFQTSKLPLWVTGEGEQCKFIRPGINRVFNFTQEVDKMNIKCYNIIKIEEV